MSALERVHSYFDREAERFDAIYDRTKRLDKRLRDEVFRGVIYQRQSLILNAIPARGASILDVGCGPGRYGLELARRGATRCVGIDVAERMIERAVMHAREAMLSDRCEFLVSEYLGWTPPAGERYDAVIATGYFDYLDDPQPHLARMIEHCKGVVYASFPKLWEVRVPFRIARFRMEGGFVRFYQHAETLALFERCVGQDKLGYLALVDLGRDYLAIYNAAAAAQK